MEGKRKKRKLIYHRFKLVIYNSFLEMAKNHSLMPTRLDFVDLNLPSVTSFLKYLFFSHMEALYVISTVCLGFFLICGPLLIG